VDIVPVNYRVGILFMKESIALAENTHSLNEKTSFLSRPETYGDTSMVEVIETHMSLVFLTDRFVYKLKKPVSFDFLDFRTLEARYKYCVEEVNINQHLGGDTYIGVVPVSSVHGEMQLDGEGEVADWLVKMKRLPADRLLKTAIKEGTVRKEWLDLAAEKISDFYLCSHPVYDLDCAQFRSTIMRDIELNSAGLLDNCFKLNKAMIISIATDLLHSIIKYAYLFDQRITGGKVIDAHGDLRPEHICLGPEPVMIDRLEFNRDLRIMDVAEELSFFAMECEVMDASAVGQLFINVYKIKSGDEIPDRLIHFYKAKRALLRARLSIYHLLEEKYLSDSSKWIGKCEAYLQAAAACCKKNWI